ncbi:MAG: PulJ/GspJ family protein [Kiritimatiellia bacterium]|jgi:type II secretory pathway pseudopilin PulG
MTFPRPAASRKGFSLIEILVATTILIAIVLMVSLVFQQSIGSWASGSRRADTQMTVRAIIGSIQRDLVNAIPDPGNVWNNNRISFLAIVGDPAANAGYATQAITYSYGGGIVTREDGSGRVRLNETCPLESFEFNFPASWGAGGAGLPERVDIKISVETEGREGLVSARCLGPDGERDTDDDIYVGGRP